MARYDDAGDLNRRITFQKFVGDRDIVGDFQYLEDSNWEDVVTVWGASRDLSSREFYAAGQETGEVTHTLKIRKRTWDSDPSAMRALILGKRYRILSPPIDIADGRVYQIFKAAEIWP